MSSYERVRRSFKDEYGRIQTLNSIMEIDHVVRVDSNGNITDDTGLYAPEVFDGSWEGFDWTEFSHGYTTQHGVQTPMHNSEYVGGRLADDMLAKPGYYVAVACTWDGDVTEGWMLMFRELD